jgi:hypothetical protein
LRQSAWWKRRRSSGLCHYCGGHFPVRELTMDHVVPLVRGGKTTKQNVVPCCKECNSKKRYLLPIEWEEYMQGLHGEGRAGAEPEVGEASSREEGGENES